MTDTPEFNHSSFSFWEDLEANNRNDWFNTHKAEFIDNLERPFAHLLEVATVKLQASGINLSGGKATMFRLNRDIRFSQDKSPYKTNLSGLLTRSGTKRDAIGLVYLQIDAFGGFVAAGFYGLEPAKLVPIRQAMVERSSEFAALLNRLNSVGLDFERSDILTSMPKGFSAFADHPHAGELRLKNLIVRENFQREDWITGRVADRLVFVASACDELISFGAAT
jgi:uncharacterized protein (TIGR02453 family)